MSIPEAINLVASGCVTFKFVLEKDMELTQIGFAVRTARRAARISAKELASAVSLTPAALSKIENGNQNLDFKTAITIAGFLKISLDHLATLATSVSDAIIETDSTRREFAKRYKQLEQKGIETALALIHDTPFDSQID